MSANPVLRNFLVTCVALVVLALVFFVYLRRHASTQSSGTVASSTSQTLPDGTTVTGLPAGAVVTEIPTTPQVSAPSFTPIMYASSVSGDVRAVAEEHFKKDVQLLKINPQDFNAWMDLAIVYKIGGDYHGAEAIWIYATKEWPESSVAFKNLGDLYQNFLHDSAKAQIYYEKAATIDDHH